MLLSTKMLSEGKILVKEYDTNLFYFRQIFSAHCIDMVNCYDLEDLHTYIAKPDKILTVGEDQKTQGHEMLYKIESAYQKKTINTKKNIRSRSFLQIYEEFIQFLERGVFKEKLVYQRLPTLRIHLPNNLSVGEYHRDCDYNHPVDEINIWVPLTKAEKTASLYIESSYDAGDYKPLNIFYGQYVIFSSFLKHGNEINLEEYTRVSFDFRVIPASRYQNSNLASINEKIKFALGEYYKIN